MSLVQEIRATRSGVRELRQFGLTIGTLLMVLGVVAVWRGNGLEFWFLLPAVAFIFGGMTAPAMLWPLQKVWMAFALLLGFVMTRVILTVLFYAVVTPIGLLGRLLGHDFLSSPAGRSPPSYWIPWTGDRSIAKDYERQY